MSDPPEQSSWHSDAPTPDDPLKSSGIKSGEASLKLFAEDLVVGKETVETGRLRVRKETHTREADVDTDLLREDAVVETIPKGYRIFAMPTSRVEGDTTIIPVVEEVLYTEKRLILKEELRITRRRTTQHFHDTVTLRHQEAVVSRIQSATDQPGVESGHNLKKPQE
jgi:uncharacterized protein (TIGR02271 family)